VRPYNACALTKTERTNLPSTTLSPSQLCGVLLPITTPFHNDGALDLDGLCSNLRKWSETGIAGYVVLGSTGERVHLDEGESLRVIVKAREEVSSEKLFIAGAGQQSTRGTINEVKRIAAAVTLDAFLVITPHFYRSAITQKALLDHYQEVADESSVPLILYSMPALTGVRIEPETTARLSEHQNIIGIKDSSADIERLKETVKLVRKDFAVLTGNGTVSCEAFSAGACGAILAVGCVVPALCLAIFHAVKSGDIGRATELQQRLSPLATAVTTRFGIGGLKAGMELKGFAGGSVRTPLRAPDDDSREEIRRCLEEAEKALQELSTDGAETPRRYADEVRLDA
jgi:4-hydroxy-tetrahydrodipicolinate synthase